MKNKLLFILLLIAAPIAYIFIRDYSYLYLYNSDSWIHGAKVIKYLFDSGPFDSPIFLEDKNHYFPIAYLTSNIFGLFVGENSLFGYGIMSFVLKILTSLVNVITVKRIFGIRWNFLLLLVFLIDPNFGTEYNPNLVSIVFIILMIFVSTFSKLPFFIFCFFLLFILHTHIFFLFFPIVFSAFYFFFKKYSVRGKFLNWNWNDLVNFHLNPLLLIFILLLFFYSFSQNSGFSMSEISIDPNTSFICLLGIGFISKILSYVDIKSRPSVAAIMGIYILMFFFYVSGLWLFHSQYFSGFFVRLVLFPGTILVFYNYLKCNKYSHLIVIVFCFLSIFPIIYKTYLNNIVIEGYKSGPLFRKKLVAEFLPYGSLFKGKVLFIDPGNYLNRFMVIDFANYLYSVHYGGYASIKEKPYTTIPDKLETFPQFFHAKDRIELAVAFLENPNTYTYSNLSRYKIDFFVIKKDVKYKNVHDFLDPIKNIKFKTKNYIIYKN